MSVKFYKCMRCGKMVGVIVDSPSQLVCCGEPMVEMVANTTDAAQEKHVPVVTVDGDKVTVKVGSVEHPMLEEHYIQWIYIATEHGGQRKALKPGDKPEATFSLDNDKAIAAYAMCNLHGLWKADI